jgi:hypothetical protein
MIGKIIKGSGFQGCLCYVMGKTGAVVIDTNMDGNNPYSLATEFSLSWQLRPKLGHTVCHIILSLSPDEHLNDVSWQKAIAQYLKEMGFTNNQYIAVKHTDQENHEHIHLVTSRVKMDGSVVSDSWDWTRSQKSLRKLEMDFGLASVPSSRTSDRQEETYRHIEKERTSGKPTVKKQLANKISAALAYTKSLPDFIEQLNRDQIRVKVERDREGKPRGIAYKYEGVRLSGSSVGKAYSLPRILKQLEISASEIVKPNIYNLKPHISQVIMEQIKSGMAMPQFIEQIRQSGVDAYVKYTRNKKVKGISYSFGDNSIQGNELGKEFSWGGLQKYLQVSYDPVRDMPIILEMQGANSKATSQESPPQASEGLPDSLFAELALELERLRSLQLPNPIQPENVIENKISITPEHEGMDKAHLVAALCHQLLNELGADNFGETGKNSYGIQRSGDALTVENLRGDRQIILQVKGQEIEFANLSEFDIQQFEQARQLQKELKKEHWRDK